MSSPLINRWGLNTYWYNMWFNDISPSDTLNQDKIFSELITSYLFYGINLPYNIFANTYWYQSQHYTLSTQSYYRWITRRGSQFGELIRYSLRKEVDCLFPMKLWILKYDTWIIINQYWFYPLKKKSIGKRSVYGHSFDSLHSLKAPKISLIKRLKTLMFLSFMKNYGTSRYYIF